jgi:hypothetical protein
MKILNINHLKIAFADTFKIEPLIEALKKGELVEYDYDSRAYHSQSPWRREPLDISLQLTDKIVPFEKLPEVRKNKSKRQSAKEKAQEVFLAELVALDKADAPEKSPVSTPEPTTKPAA